MQKHRMIPARPPLNRCGSTRSMQMHRRMRRSCGSSGIRRPRLVEGPGAGVAQVGTFPSARLIKALPAVLEHAYSRFRQWPRDCKGAYFEQSTLRWNGSSVAATAVLYVERNTPRTSVSRRAVETKAAPGTPPVVEPMLAT